MSLDYDLYVGEGLGEAELVELIRHKMGFELRGREFRGLGVDGVVCETGAVRGAILWDELRLVMGWRVGMRVDLSAYDEARGHLGIESILKLSLHILKQGRFDALLLFNGETPCLIRKSGRLHLKRDFWTAMDRLALVDVPYELQDLPEL